MSTRCYSELLKGHIGLADDTEANEENELLGPQFAEVEEAIR